MDSILRRKRFDVYTVLDLLDRVWSRNKVFLLAPYSLSINPILGLCWSVYVRCDFNGIASSQVRIRKSDK